MSLVSQRAHRMRRAAIFAFFCGLSRVVLAATAQPVYKDASASVEQRVDDLLARMSLEEKIAQITAVWTQKPQIFNARGDVDPAKIAKVFPAGIGITSNPMRCRRPCAR